MPSLSVKYRPNDFNEIVGQDVITKILNYQLQTGKIKNTYLFCGASGCGKTTAARAFIRRLNNSDNSANETLTDKEKALIPEECDCEAQGVDALHFFVYQIKNM